VPDNLYLINEYLICSPL